MQKDEKPELSFDEVIADARTRILAEMVPNVTFDGWSVSVLAEAIAASGVGAAEAKLAFPRGAIDAAIEFHRAADRKMIAGMADIVADVPRFSEKITAAVFARLNIAAQEKEAVRRAASLMALPQNMTTGAGLIWETVNHIWRGLGDNSAGFSHYSKRASLGSVYSSTFLFWLTDDDPEMAPTREFLERRIENVMQFGKFTSKFKVKS